MFFLYLPFYTEQYQIYLAVFTVIDVKFVFFTAVYDEKLSEKAWLHS